MRLSPLPAADWAFRRLLTHFARSFVRDRGAAVAGCGALIITSAFVDAFRVALLVPIIDLLSGHQENARWAHRLAAALGAIGFSSEIARTCAMVTIFVIASMLRAAIVYGRDVLSATLQTGMMSEARSHLMSRVAAAPWKRIATLDHSRLSNLVTVEAVRVGTAAQLLIAGASGIVLLFIQIGLACILAPKLSMATMVVLAAAAGFTLMRQRQALEIGKQFSSANTRLMTSANRFLGGLKAAMAQNAAASFVDEFEHAQQAVAQKQLDFIIRRSRRNLALGIFATIATGLIVLVGFEVANIRLSVILTVMFLFYRMGGPAIQIYASAQQLAFSLSSYATLLDIHASLDLGQEVANAVPRPLPSGAIKLCAASYHHPGGGGVESVDLSLRPGEFVGVMGPSGHGKTTLTDLLAALLSPQSGALWVGDVNITAEGRDRDWREEIAYVTQEGFLFNDTLRRNLRWGLPAVSDAQLLEALERVGAKPLLSRLGGLDGILGERGTLISGGERQRIAIARALIRRPRLLLLDEATSAIDASSEADLLDHLATLQPCPSILLVSHRLESMRRCHRIVRVEYGKLMHDVAPNPHG